MKVLHLNTTDVSGGAGIAANRLHKALRKQGIESFMLVQDKKSEDQFVYSSSRIPFINRIRIELDYFLLRFLLKNKANIFSLSIVPDALNKKIQKIDPDIIHMHWIAGGFIKIESLKNFNKPILWSLHDMWPFTGGCHYTEECENYKSNCDVCPMLKPGSTISKRVFNRKLNVYKDIDNLYITGLSKWLANCAESSKLFSQKKIYNIPNCIDINEFYPMSKATAKKEMRIPVRKKNIIFGAVAGTRDKRKGFDLLIEALLKMKIRDDKVISIFGNAYNRKNEIAGFEINYLGNISSVEILRTIYSAADVMIVPSRQENLSNIVLESLACGTPVVAFNIGGMPDLIKHKETGYLAEAFDTTDLLRGIEWVLEHRDALNLSENAYQYVTQTYEQSIVANKYIDIYKEIISKSIGKF